MAAITNEKQNEQQETQMDETNLELEKQPDTKIGKKLVNILDNLLKNGDWDSSLFLKTVKRRIQDIITETEDIIAEAEAEREATGVQDKVMQPVPAGYMRVYILLYQTEGNKLMNWRYALRALLAHSISRPTYQNEQHVQELIRSKKDAERYGYAIVNIVQDGVYPQEFPPKDILGHEMIVLKEDALKRDNIIGFVHANKRRYNFVEGELIEQGEV